MIICHEQIYHKLLVGTILSIYGELKRQSIEEKIHNTSELRQLGMREFYTTK